MRAFQMCLLLLLFSSLSTNAHLQDSSALESASSQNLIITSSFHTMGMFSLTGRLVSENPVFDVRINYLRKKWGIQTFKAFDLRDHTTKINFSLVAVNKPFSINPKLTITPSVGFIVDQVQSVADEGTDVAGIIAITYNLTDSFTVDFNALFYNLVLGPKERDWVNRSRMVYTYKHIGMILSTWYNNNLLDTTSYLTCGAGLSILNLRLSQRLTGSFGVNAIGMPYSSDSISIPKKNGIYLSVSIGFD